MSQIRSIFMAGCSSLLLAALGMAADSTNNLLINKSYLIETPPGATVAAGYLQITNRGNRSDLLLGGSSTVAAKVEIHESTLSGDIAKMRKFDEGLVIPAGKTVELKPGSYHLMFINLLTPVMAGEQLPVTLHFRDAGEVTVLMSVTGRGAAAIPEHKSHRSDQAGNMETLHKQHAPVKQEIK